MTATCVKGAGNVFLKSSAGDAIVAPLPCDGAVDALLKRHGFGVAQIVDGALRSGLLIQSVVIFSADILHQAVIFAASRKDEVRKKLHVDVSAARDVIDGARLESFEDVATVHQESHLDSVRNPGSAGGHWARSVGCERSQRTVRLK